MFFFSKSDFSFRIPSTLTYSLAPSSNNLARALDFGFEVEEKIFELLELIEGEDLSLDVGLFFVLEDDPFGVEEEIFELLELIEGGDLSLDFDPPNYFWKSDFEITMKFFDNG